MKIINFFRSKNGDFEYAVCDDGNVYRRNLDKHLNWSDWSIWVKATSIKFDLENQLESDGN